jgi:hypothetical protein
MNEEDLDNLAKYIDSKWKPIITNTYERSKKIPNKYIVKMLNEANISPQMKDHNDDIFKYMELCNNRCERCEVPELVSEVRRVKGDIFKMSDRCNKSICTEYFTKYLKRRLIDTKGKGATRCNTITEDILVYDYESGWGL